MDSSNSPIQFTALLVSLAILFLAILTLTTLHFLLQKLQNRVHPSTTPPATSRVQLGVDKSVLDSILIQPYKKKPRHYKECVVCLSELGEGEMVRVLPKCRHVFHVWCIDAWFASHATCPFCRSEVDVGGDFVVDVEEEVVGEGSNHGGGIRRANTFVFGDDVGLVSFREKLRLKRYSSLDSRNSVILQ